MDSLKESVALHLLGFLFYANGFNPAYEACKRGKKEKKKEKNNPGIVELHGAFPMESAWIWERKPVRSFSSGRGETKKREEASPLLACSAPRLCLRSPPARGVQATGSARGAGAGGREARSPLSAGDNGGG